MDVEAQTDHRLTGIRKKVSGEINRKMKVDTRRSEERRTSYDEG